MCGSSQAFYNNVLVSAKRQHLGQNITFWKTLLLVSSCPVPSTTLVSNTLISLLQKFYNFNNRVKHVTTFLIGYMSKAQSTEWSPKVVPQVYDDD